MENETGKRPMSYGHDNQKERKIFRHIALAVLMFAVLGCADTRDETSTLETVSGDAIEPASTAFPDSNNLDTDEVIADASNDDGQANPEPPSFMGTPCTDDCSGHEAGYQWAEENGIDDPDNCSGNSNSFVEGCKAYAEEQ